MKIIVAHPQQQHSYRLAVALKKSGMLAAYCTTVYYRQGSLTSYVARFLPEKWKKKATSRHCDELSDNEVYQYNELEGLFVLLCHNIPIFRKYYDRIRRYTEDRFARKVANLACRLGVDAVIGYDGVSAHLFEEVKRLSPSTVCITDMSAANALYLKHVYELDLQLHPEYEASLKLWNRIWDPIDIARTKNELTYSDRFLCASFFVQRSLTYSGIAVDKCQICPYGVDFSTFPYIPRKAKKAEDPIIFVYVGQVAEHKGISCLIESFKEIDPERACLICVGDVRLPRQILNELPASITMTGSISHDEVSSVLLSADVMLFASLGDGFSLSIMEALSSGLPVVCSENTGSADCIVDGYNGFVVPVFSNQSMIAKINWFIEHRDDIPIMAENARESVQHFTWDDYYRNAALAVHRLIEG